MNQNVRLGSTLTLQKYKFRDLIQLPKCAHVVTFFSFLCYTLTFLFRLLREKKVQEVDSSPFVPG